MKAISNIPSGINTPFSLFDLFVEDSEKDNFSYSDVEDISGVFDKIDKDWDKEIWAWFNSNEEVEGDRKDLDDWDIWNISPGSVYEDRYDELLANYLDEYENEYVDENGMTTLSKISYGFLRYLKNDFDNNDYLEEYGTLVHEGHWKSESYWRS